MSTILNLIKDLLPVFCVLWKFKSLIICNLLRQRLANLIINLIHYEYIYIYIYIWGSSLFVELG